MSENRKEYLSIEECVSIATLSEINISHDGENVAFVKNIAKWEEQRYRECVWIYESKRERLYQLATKKDSTSPLWAPNFKCIAYLSLDDNGINQIFIKWLDSDNEVQITKEEEGVSQFKWRPNGEGFYYIAGMGEAERIKKRREIYGDFIYVDKEYQNDCLYYIKLELDEEKKYLKEQGNSKCRLTDNKKFHIHEFDISSDGEKIIFVATPSSKGEDYEQGELYILDIRTGNLEQVENDKLLGIGLCFSPEGTKVYFSPDGDKICYKASLKEKTYYKTEIPESTIEIYDIKTKRIKRTLSDFDSSVTPVGWTSKGILIRWQDKTNYLIGLLSEDGKIKTLSEVDNVTVDVSMTKDGNNIAYSMAKPNEIFEIYLNHKKITSENDILKGKIKSNRSIVSWKSSDELDIEGVLTTPKDFDRNKKYPLLLVIHGGPEWAAFPIHSECFNEKYPIEQFIEKGFIVLEPNYRGSSGYGNKFLKANYKNLGIGDYEDIISGVDFLIEKGFVDREKVGLMGWSQGGYISAFCSTYSNRFKAISIGGGVSNWNNYYANTSEPQSITRFLGGTPWENSEIYAKASPMTYIKNACTPTLIQHGKYDTGITVSNAYELYRGLKDMGVHTELIIFNEMGYSPTKPTTTLAIRNQNLKWFLQHILDKDNKEKLAGVHISKEL